MPWTSTLARTARPVTAPVMRALGMLPVLPWYAWAGIAGGVLLLLGMTRTAGAATSSAAPAPAQPGGSPPLLKIGSTGPWVAFLQGKLGLKQTSSFDSVTDAAVRDLQKSHGLTVDGIVGHDTWSALGVTGPAPAQPSGGAPGPSPSPTPTPKPPSPPTVGNPFGLSALASDREGQILSFVGQGSYEHEWVPLTWTKDGHTASILVSRRALALSDGTNRLTVNASFNTAQKIADMIGGAMLTTRIADEMWRQAGTRLGILNKSWNTDSPVTGGKTDRMYEQSNDIAQKLAQKGDSGGIVANEGKDWVLTRRFWNPPAGVNPSTAGQGATGSPHNAANFGWYPGGSKSPGGEPLIQSVGLAHERTFTDYSQLLRFVKPDSLTIDGVPYDYAAALSDPALSGIIQDEGGTLPAARHPDLL
jgi:putative peptidoglycan binding protein